MCSSLAHIPPNTHSNKERAHIFSLPRKNVYIKEGIPHLKRSSTKENNKGVCVNILRPIPQIERKMLSEILLHTTTHEAVHKTLSVLTYDRRPNKKDFSSLLGATEKGNG